MGLRDAQPARAPKPVVKGLIRLSGSQVIARLHTSRFAEFFPIQAARSWRPSKRVRREKSTRRPWIVSTVHGHLDQRFT
jgi:hypothetical protein